MCTPIFPPYEEAHICRIVLFWAIGDWLGRVNERVVELDAALPCLLSSI